MNTPAVSIVMPAYNAAQTLGAAIDSVLAQILPDCELLLVVDSKSADATREGDQAAAHETRTRLITDLPGDGCVFNCNEAISRATGEFIAFIAFIDSDDLWMPDKLKKQVCFMQQTGCDPSYTVYTQMNWSGRHLPHLVTPPLRLNYNDLLNDNLVACQTAMIRPFRFPDINFKDNLYDDFTLWLSLLRKTVAQGLPKTPAVYPQAARSRSGNKMRAACARWRIFRRFEKLSLTRPVTCFARYALAGLRKRSAKVSHIAA